MKERITGRVKDGFYEIVHPGETVVHRVTLEEGRNDTKLKAAIERNGWPQIPE